MSLQRISGVVLMAIGVILLFVGTNASHSVVDQVSNTFTGRFTQATMWYIIGGVALAVLGVLMTFVNVRGKLA
jgi:succinate dehydrogenase/fumarate reductase cytochrome b subunit